MRNPYRNFLPSTGRLVKYRPPAEGSEDGITCATIPAFMKPAKSRSIYDPMIAKLVTHAELHRPIRHNIPFL